MAVWDYQPGRIFSFANLMVREVIGMCCVQSLQMNDSTRMDARIKHFVREHLGCDCPDEVFDRITVTEQPEIFSAKHTAYEIGGRLFVAVFAPADWHEITMQLDKLVFAGKQFRDRHGYNRFRLVIVTDDDNAEKDLHQVFNNLPVIDEKTHLHIIKTGLVP
jgi:hypothetical protein